MLKVTVDSEKDSVIVIGSWYSRVVSSPCLLLSIIVKHSNIITNTGKEENNV